MGALNPETPFILGSAKIAVAGGAATLVSQTGLLDDSSGGPGAVIYNAAGDYTLNLDPSCDVGPDDCYVLSCVAESAGGATGTACPNVDLSGLAGAIANPATQASIEVFFFDDAGAAVDTSFDITLAKRPRG